MKAKTILNKIKFKIISKFQKINKIKLKIKTINQKGYLILFKILKDPGNKFQKHQMNTLTQFKKQIINRLKAKNKSKNLIKNQMD